MRLAAMLDTNVIMSGFLWQGLSYRILRLAEDGEIGLFTSIPLLEELVRTLSRPKFLPTLTVLEWTPLEIRSIVESFADIVEPARSFKVIVADDPSDDAVILTAVSARCDCIVIGNLHLLKLKSYRGIDIVTPSAFLKLL